MGVRGLTTYINCNEDAFLQAFLLHESKLIIDGHSLCAQLYCKLNCFSAFGGDYDKFTAYVKHFFKNLRKCNITAYVLFDGSYERKKLRTAYNRLRSKIYGASRLDFVTQTSLQIFPLLLRDIFIEALIDMSVPFTVCEFEADDEIAAMARQLNCPVLSYDSDFFIYNVLYIPFNTLDLKPTPMEENDIKFYALKCKIYRVENLINKFGGLKEELLPLLATLLGNDYVEKKVFNKFFSQLKLPKSKKKKNEQQRCIHGLFKWLQNESLDSAMAKILGRLKKTQKDKVFAIMKKSIEGYYNNICKSLDYFDITPKENCQDRAIILKYPEQEDITEITEAIPNENNDNDDGDDAGDTSNDEISDNETVEDTNGLPSWFTKGIRLNKIPKCYINLYTHHVYFCSPQAENYSADDSFLHNLSILRYAFDLLTDFSEDSCIYVSREKNSNYKRVSLDHSYSIPRLYDVTLSELTEDQLNSCFYHFLKQKMELLDLELINLLPSNFRLFMISVLFWVKHCDVPTGLVHSLIICYIMLDAIDERTGMFRGHYFFNNKYSTKLEEYKKKSNQNQIDDTELYLNKNKIQYEDCLIAASTLLKFFEIDEKLQKRPKTYDVKKMHTFAQFQCTLMQFNSLNTLCGCPVESTKYSKSFNGTFVYNLAVKLENQLNPTVFVEQYLKGADTILMFYKSFVKIYDQCACKMNIINVNGAGKNRRRKKNVEYDEIGFLVKGFESEVVI